MIKLLIVLLGILLPISFALIINGIKESREKNEQQKKQSILSAKTAEMMRVWSEDIESYKLESIKELQSMIDKNNKKVDEYKKRVEELKYETEKF